jgi:alpha-glucosidase
MMHDQALTDNPPRGEDAGWAKTRPYDFQRHIHNQSQPEITDFLRRIRTMVDEYGERYLVAEIDREHADREMKAYTQGEDLLQSAYGFNYLYADALTPELVRSATSEWSNAPDEGWPSWTFSNHDAPRAVSRWLEGRDRKAFADLMVLLLASLRGNVFLYQGEELGLPQAHVPFERLQDPEAIANWPLTLGRDGARTPLPWSDRAPNNAFSDAEPWLPMGDDHGALSVSVQDADPNSTLNWTRKVLELRNTHPALRSGDIEFLDAPEPLLAIVRGEGPGAILCAFNLGHDTAEWAPPAGWRVVTRINAGGEFGALAALEGLIAERA